jgi:thiamine biosynthesis lipoprotein
MPFRKRRRALALAIIHALLCAPLARADWFSRVDDGIMGTRISMQLWADDPALAQRAIEAVLAEMRRVDELMSTYKTTSELSRVNAEAAKHPVQVTPELFQLLGTSLEYSKITEGAFDITYASVGYLYDFHRRIHPSDAAIEKALPGIDFRHVLLNARSTSVRFSQSGVRIDLGGIAKGHAVDRAIAILESMGIGHAVVSAGGDSRVIGDRFGKPWIIGIRNPRSPDPDAVITRIPLTDSAMSTSGDYERFFEEGGVRYHHIIDPKTGHSASKVLSATIIGPTATRTDGLSKTAFVLGPEEALRIINGLNDVDAVFVTPDGRILYSNGLQPPN